MSTATHGIRLHSGSRIWRGAVELLSSMRFAISLLTVICIASVIGTVLKQGEPPINYINQFGPFWAAVFEALGLYGVYNAWWFWLILAFLVVSTSLCVARTTPKIARDWGQLKENIRASGLKAFAHKASGTVAQPPSEAAQRVAQLLAGAGWRVKLQTRTGAENEAPGFMVAAKKGSANKLGYIAAHSAIVLICLGALFDGDLFIRMQMWFGGKQVFGGAGMIADVPAQHRIAASNPAFRGNMLVSEGTSASTAILSQPGGVLLQELPFSIELKKFIVEYYSTGMPKLFASDIVIHDKETGEKLERRVEVNHPATHRGVAIYQSSFDDGGSRVKLRALPMTAAAKAFEVEGVVGGSTELTNGNQKLTLEFGALRVINVENFSKDGVTPQSGATDVRKVDLRASLEERLGAGNKTVTRKELRNVGPSIQYKLRDGAGQATEYHNYMLPVDLGDGVPVFLLGMRETPQEPFRFLRAPADEKGNLDGFVRLRAAFLDPAARQAAMARHAARVTDPARPATAQAAALFAQRAVELFLSEKEPAKGGLNGMAAFLDANVPQDQREKVSEVLVQAFNGVIFELNQSARQAANLPPLEANEATQAFLAQAVLALSDAQIFSAPMAFALQDFTHVQASVFQLARGPGKWVVYLGCAFLIVGIFAMLYVRERRVWVWVRAGATGATDVDVALSSNRQTMDVDREFERLRDAVLSGARGNEAKELKA